MTGSSANKLAAERADTAVVAALTPICVEKFLQNSDAKANLAVLQKISTSWEQGDYLPEGRLGDSAGGNLLRLPLGQGVRREVAPRQTCSPMNP